MKRIKIDGVKPGDILFTARPEKVSKTIRTGTGGIVSHAMICVQHGCFIDSTPSGVQARNLQRELFEDDEKAFHFRLINPPEREVTGQIVDFARAEIGARYSIREAMRSVIAVHRPRSRRQFCSRLVARVYKLAGIDLVPDADYCSPEDLRRSPLLEELPIEFEPVFPEELAWRSSIPDPIQAMHDAQNAVLDAARSVEPAVENFDDLSELLVRQPDADQVIADALRSSGYLDIWKIEVERHPWRYVYGLMDGLAASPESITEYCIGTVKEAYSGGFRFAITLVQLQALQEQYPRESFRLEINLYETLVRNDQNRREVAYNWLERHHPELLKQHMEEIEPHTQYWWSVVDRVEPRLGALSRQAVSSMGGNEVCSSCGDEPAYPYRVVNGAEILPGVPSLRLCDDCLGIRRGMGNVLMPFLSEPPKT
ncbi:MAG: hypothetical protein VR70_16960 [Rhodospirillaceae bacterium BRH_c57]|nr:MAG: hypothetical protein VR70_16960 [Rhodospirillaceae bacterium BRH_c57]